MTKPQQQPKSPPYEDEVLRRMLSTPPKTHAPAKEPAKKAPKKEAP